MIKRRLVGEEMRPKSKREEEKEKGGRDGEGEDKERDLWKGGEEETVGKRGIDGKIEADRRGKMGLGGEKIDK